MDVAVPILIMLFCLVTEAFFSGSEMAVVSADRIKLRHDAAQGSAGARLALRMLEKPAWLLSTTLVGTNISVVTNTTMATALVIHLFGEAFGWLAIVIAAPLIWIFGEIVAKSIFQQHADTITPRAIFLLRAASYLFLPILAVFNAVTSALTRLLGDGDNRNPFTLREEISMMLEMSAAEGDIEPRERRMIRRVFNFSETTADDIMVPLIDVVAVSRDANCGETRRLAVSRAHKRLPVFDGRIDNIVGLLNVLDILGQTAEQPLAPFVRPVPHVSASIAIEALLSNFRQGAETMAVVVDEFGGAQGIVMLEDILEVIVGELEDEFDAAESGQDRVTKLGEREFLVSARIELERLKQAVGVELPKGNYETLAGFLMHQVKAVPRQGAVIESAGVTFTIERGTQQAIEEIRIRC